MKIMVLGSGVIGTATAWYLTRAGHEVTVLERQNGAGLETSFANAGEISPGYSSPWAAPGIPLKALKWMLGPHSPLIIRPSLDGAQWSWMWQMLMNCNHASYERNKSRMLRLAQYSRDCMIALRRETGIRYDERTQGTLQLFRQAKQLDHAAIDSRILQDSNIAHEVLDRAGCIRHEPALAKVADKFVGGMHIPGDETGDCFMFTQELAKMAAAHGARFEYGVTLERLLMEGERIIGVQTGQGLRTADAYVLALGSYSPLLLKPLGLKIPVFPMKGYSLTIPIKDAAGAPESTILDESYKVALTRLGDRIRVGGMAEIAGYDLRLHEARRATLVKTVTDLFPHGGAVEQAQFWCGLRPMTPDSTPIVGPTQFGNLFINTGHGTLGWTMACGSGRMLSDLISGKQPEIDTAGLFMDRYRGAGSRPLVLPALQSMPTAPGSGA
jgi:D-amino-acid dehydrogenase